MLPQSFLLSLLTAASVLASSPPREDSPDNQRVLSHHGNEALKSHPVCEPVDAQEIECPDGECGTWCTPKDGTECMLRLTKPVHDIFGLLSVIFGFDFPVNVRLCPVGQCSKKCLCREKLLKQLTVLLLSNASHEKQAAEEKDEL